MTMWQHWKWGATPPDVLGSPLALGDCPAVRAEMGSYRCHQLALLDNNGLLRKAQSFEDVESQALGVCLWGCRCDCGYGCGLGGCVVQCVGALQCGVVWRGVAWCVDCVGWCIVV